MQATEAGERAIIDAVLQGLPARLPPRPRIAELYSGCGTLTFALAAGGTAKLRVAAWEGDAASVAALQQAIGQSRPVRSHHGNATRPCPPAAVGQGTGRVRRHCAPTRRMPVRRRRSRKSPSLVWPTVIYVSCNPATLGRDAKLLREAGYSLTSAAAIDQFLWSARLEAVCVFRRV